MIGINLGKAERITRFVSGLLLFGLVVVQPTVTATGWLISLIALFLVLNGIYGRCYLWHILELSSCGCNQFSRQRLCDKPGS